MIKYRPFNLWTQNETSLLMNKIFFSGNKKDITYEIPRKWDSRLSSFQSLDNLCLLYYPTSMLCLYSKVRKIKNYKIIPSKLQKDSNNVKSIFVFINFKVNIQKIGIIITFSYTYNTLFLFGPLPHGLLLLLCTHLLILFFPWVVTVFCFHVTGIQLLFFLFSLLPLRSFLPISWGPFLVYHTYIQI